MARMSSIAYTLQNLFGRLNEELFPELRRCKHVGRRIKCIRFADDMILLAEDERMLKNMLMLLNYRCEDYGMKININKTKSMVVRRKPKKVDMRIKAESDEQVDSFKYLECNISSNLICCEEVKQRIAIAKESFNRK